MSNFQRTPDDAARRYPATLRRCQSERLAPNQDNSSPSLRDQRRKRKYACLGEDTVENTAEKNIRSSYSEFRQATTYAAVQDLMNTISQNSNLVYEALKNQWKCHCQKCSYFAIGLIPTRQKAIGSIPGQTTMCFKAFFGLGQMPQLQLLEADLAINNAALHQSEAVAWDLCTSVSQLLYQHSSLHLNLEKSNFQFKGSTPKKFQDSLTPVQITLESVFRAEQALQGEHILTTKGKFVLATALATALVPLLDTPLLPVSLRCHDILFFRPLREETLADITKPFLQLQRAPFTTAANENAGVGDSYASERPTRIAHALGVLLYEIYFVNAASGDEGGSSAANFNASLNSCRGRLERLEAAGGGYYKATKWCLEANMNSQITRQAMYEKVIRPLRENMFQLDRTALEMLDSFDAEQIASCWTTTGRVFVSYVEAGTENPFHPAIRDEHPGGTGSRLSGYPKGTFSDARYGHLSEHENAVARVWMKNLRLAVSSVQEVPLPRSIKPVRLAIMDSGFNKGSTVDSRIKDWCNFLPGADPSDIGDEFGHGTNVLNLVLSAAPAADIYVGKITREKMLGPKSYPVIVEGLRHTMQTWNADIICMSFGIWDHYTPFYEAIMDAIDKKVLIFAAASNEGANAGRPFPANHPGVFCIHATDGYGNSALFNPTRVHTDVNFSLLGVDVPVGPLAGHASKPVTGKYPTMSGTSAATPLAAGIAASILHVVHGNNRDGQVSEWLKRADAMREVLKGMTTKRHGYDYISSQGLKELLSDGFGLYKAAREKMMKMCNDGDV